MTTVFKKSPSFSITWHRFWFTLGRTLTPLLPLLSDLGSKTISLAPNGTNPGLFRTYFSTFWLDEPKRTEISSEKKAWICPIWVNLTYFGAKCEIRAWYWPDVTNDDEQVARGCQHGDQWDEDTDTQVDVEGHGVGVLVPVRVLQAQLRHIRGHFRADWLHLVVGRIDTVSLLTQF